MEFGNAVADGRPRVRHYVLMPARIPAEKDGTRGPLCTIDNRMTAKRKRVRVVMESPLPLCKGCERERAWWADLPNRAAGKRRRAELNKGPSNRRAPPEGEQERLL